MGEKFKSENNIVTKTSIDRGEFTADNKETKLNTPEDGGSLDEITRINNEENRTERIKQLKNELLVDSSDVDGNDKVREHFKKFVGELSKKEAIKTEEEIGGVAEKFRTELLSKGAEYAFGNIPQKYRNFPIIKDVLKEEINKLKDQGYDRFCYSVLKMTDCKEALEIALSEPNFLFAAEGNIKASFSSRYMETIESALELSERLNFPHEFFSDPEIQKLANDILEISMRSGKVEKGMYIMKLFNIESEKMLEMAEGNLEKIFSLGGFDKQPREVYEIAEKLGISSKFLKSNDFIDVVEERFLEMLPIEPDLSFLIMEAFDLSKEKKEELVRRGFLRMLSLGRMDTHWMRRIGIDQETQNIIPEKVTEQMLSDDSNQEYSLRMAVKISSEFDISEDLLNRIKKQVGVSESAKEEASSAIFFDDVDRAGDIINKFNLSPELLGTRRFLSEKERDLAEREVDKNEELNGGCNKSSFVHLNGNGSGLYKPVKGEAPLREKIEKGTYYRRERASYVVDKFLGFDLVPPTIIKKINGEIGSVQAFIPDADVGSMVSKEKKEENVIKEQLKSLWVFDLLVYNSDRHNKNWMISGERIIAIDNGLCFGESELSSENQFFDEEVPAETIEKLEKLSVDTERQENLREMLLELLPKKEVDAFFNRFFRLVKIIREYNGKIPDSDDNKVIKFV